jgi:hypothetical protein
MLVSKERLSILKKENLLSIVILPGLDRKKLSLLFIWLLAWSVCGIIVIANYFRAENSQQKLFIIGYLAFWLYFEFVMIRSFIWKKNGKEKLWVKDGIINYQREINGRGKIRSFNSDLVSKMEILELKASRFSDTISQSFWVRGGERLYFVSQGKTIVLGMQLTDKEAKMVKEEFNKMLP